MSISSSERVGSFGTKDSTSAGVSRQWVEQCSDPNTSRPLAHFISGSCCLSQGNPKTRGYLPVGATSNVILS